MNNEYKPKQINSSVQQESFYRLFLGVSGRMCRATHHLPDVLL